MFLISNRNEEEKIYDNKGEYVDELNDKKYTIKNKEYMLKIYDKDNTDNIVNRNMREIAAYCFFNKNNIPFVPKMIEYGYCIISGNNSQKLYVITEVVKGISLMDYNLKWLTTIKLKSIMMRIIFYLTYINNITKFSHEDFHPENIFITNFSNSLCAYYIKGEEPVNYVMIGPDVNFIDFDLASFGDEKYEKNILPVKKINRKKQGQIH